MHIGIPDPKNGSCHPGGESHSNMTCCRTAGGEVAIDLGCWCGMPWWGWSYSLWLGHARHGRDSTLAIPALHILEMFFSRANFRATKSPGLGKTPKRWWKVNPTHNGAETFSLRICNELRRMMYNYLYVISTLPGTNSLHLKMDGWKLKISF